MIKSKTEPHGAMEMCWMAPGGCGFDSLGGLATKPQFRWFAGFCCLTLNDGHEGVS